MQQTTNYALKKIELNDSPPDITVINPNWDKIDEKLKENADGLTTHTADGAAHGIGDKSTLKTTHKTSIVGAINEAFQSASDGKKLVRNAITGKGGTVADSDGDGVPTFTELSNGVDGIPVGHKPNMHSSFATHLISTGTSGVDFFTKNGIRYVAERSSGKLTLFSFNDAGVKTMVKEIVLPSGATSVYGKKDFLIANINGKAYVYDWNGVLIWFTPNNTYDGMKILAMNKTADEFVYKVAFADVSFVNRNLVRVSTFAMGQNDGQWFESPDNNLLSVVASTTPEIRCFFRETNQWKMAVIPGSQQFLYTLAFFTRGDMV